MKRKNVFLVFVLLFASFLYTTTVKAICPVCTVAVGVGVGLSRWLGIDDWITGIWVGGLVVSFIYWTIDWLNKKQINFFGKWIVVTVAWYAIIILPMYGMGIMGHPYNMFCGMDKLLFGVIIGSILFFFANLIHTYLKKNNGNKSYFPFQKVAIPVATLLISSLILYLIIKTYNC